MKQHIVASYLALFVAIIHRIVNAYSFDKDFFLQELFGSGDFQASDKGAAKKHLSSSTEDLFVLFESEKEMVKNWRQNNSIELDQSIKTFLQSIDYE